MNKSQSILIFVLVFCSLVFFSGCVSNQDHGTTSTISSTPTTTLVSQTTIKLAKGTALGDILVDGRGMTLYLFTKDVIGKSNCYGKCAEAWPPLLIEGSLVSADIPLSDLSAVMRTDGKAQVAYKGMPLYYFTPDTNPGDLKGEGVGGVWYVISMPSDSSIPPEVAQYAKDWPLPNRDYSNTRATTDSSINSGNVGKLKTAWSFIIPGVGAYGGAASTPLILGDTVYFQDLKANVFAIDLGSGNVKWSKMYNISAVVGPNGPAVGDGKVFVAKDLYHMAALDMKTGSELWSTRVSYVNTTGIDIQPTVYDGMVYTSTVPGTADLFYAPGGVGFIYALDQATGVVKWNFSTVTSGMWGHPEVNSGGGSWYTPSIDTKTGTIYWGIGNPAPFPGTKDWPSGSSRPGPNLYTDSIVALDHRAGFLKWFTQVNPHDLFDFDFQISPILARANVSGRMRDTVIGAGKMGRVYGFDRNTGEILWVAVVGEHNLNDQLDVLPAGSTTVAPAILGGVETPMAYSDGVVYVPVIDMSLVWTPTSVDYSTLNFSKGKGELVAVDASTGKIRWYKKFDSINVGAATVVNDLVFTGTYDGTIYAFKKDTGEQVFSYKAPAGINGWPAVAGDTIVWPTGVGGTPSVIALRPTG
jgi:predicted lipoprotein with Yx(FWY)xxD motif/outer membrane protein assembly factor BamB